MDPRFGIGRRDPRARLEQLGVNVRPAGNHREEDASLESLLNHRLQVLSDDPSVPGRRNTEAARQVDAATAAAVARWRQTDPADPARGWFVATDQLTGRAYAEEVQQDPYPLVVSPAAWALYLSTISADGPEGARKLAVTLGNVATRDAFLSMATSYTVEEALRLADLMGDEGGLSESDLRLAVQLDFAGLLEGAVSRDEAEREDRATQVLRLRSSRRDKRAVRAEEHAAEAVERSREEIEQARQHAAAEAGAQAGERLEEERRRWEEQAAAREEAARQQGRAEAEEISRADRARAMRRLRAVVAFLFLVALIAGAARWGELTGWVLVAALAGLGVATAALVEYATSEHRGGGRLVLTVIAQASWTGLALALDRLF